MIEEIRMLVPLLEGITSGAIWLFVGYLGYKLTIVVAVVFSLLVVIKYIYKLLF